MSLITTCPYCATAFKVTEEQLRVRSGDVRCGHCGKVFNAFASLGSWEEISPDKPASEPLAAPVGSSQAPERQDSIAATPEEHEESNADSIEAQSGESALQVGVEEPPLFKKKPSSKLWLAGSVVLLVLIVVQGGYFYRNILALTYPALIPQLEKMCEILHCYLGPEQRPEKINIKSSDLQADATDLSVVVFTASLRNHDRVALAYPTLELTLTDVEDRMVARKLFTPEEYVGENHPVKEGMKPGTEFPVELTLNKGEIKASGYRLYLFYPGK